MTLKRNQGNRKTHQARSTHPCWNNLCLSLQRKVSSLQIFSKLIPHGRKSKLGKIRIVLTTKNNITGVSSLKIFQHQYHGLRITKTFFKDGQNIISQKKINIPFCKKWDAKEMEDPIGKAEAFSGGNKFFYGECTPSIRMQKK